MQWLAHAHVAFDVLDHHRTVVHENPDRQGETAQGHGIERLAGELDEEHRRDDGQGDRRENDHRQPHIPEEQNNDHRGEAGGHGRTEQHAVERRPDEDRLVKERLDGDVGGQHLLDVNERRTHAVDDRQGRDATGLTNAHQRTRRAVHRHRVGLHLKSIVHMRHVAHEHGTAVDLPDRERVDRVDDVRRIVHRQWIVFVADLDITGRQNDILML